MSLRQPDTGFKPAVPPRTRIAPDDDPDRDATAADLQPGPVLRTLIRAGARNNHRLARRCRLHLRQLGYHVTVQRLELARIDEAAVEFDQLVAAVEAKDFHRALAAVELLRRAFGISVTLVPDRVKAVTR